MHIYRSIEEALEAASTAESLWLKCGHREQISERIGDLENLRSLRLDDVRPDLVFPETVKRLKNLEKLDISGSLDASVPFPKVFLDSTVTDLGLRNFRVREVFELKKQLKRLRICSHFIFDDMVPLFSNFVGLEYLEIWGRHGKNQAGNSATSVFPPQIGNLQDLAELEVVYAGLNDLPAEMAALTKLRVIRLRKHDFDTFPVALTTVPNLEDLEFSHMAKLTSMPDELANMVALRRLDLSHSWNGPGAHLSFAQELDRLLDSKAESEPLPSVLGELSQLETLVLDHCGVASLDAITRLDALKTLSLAWAPLTDLSSISSMTALTTLKLEHADVSDLGPIAALSNLEVLDIRNTKVADLGPLAKLENLRALDMSSCLADDRNPHKALEAIVDLPNLEDVTSNEVTAAAWGKLRASEPSDGEAIVAGLRSESFDEFMGALHQVIDHSDDRSTDDHNALVDLFGLDVDDYEVEPFEFEPLDEALERWGREIPAMDLARLARATFISTSDGWQATLIALRLLIEAKDVDAQLFFVEAWERATQYYDGGHRSWEDGVLDQLIDDLFEQFQPEAIAALMLTLGEDQLDSEYGDAMDALYGPALQGLKVFDEDLIEHLREHALSTIDAVPSWRPHADTLAMIEDCINDSIDPIKVALREIAAEMRVQLAAAEVEEEQSAEEAAVQQDAEPDVTPPPRPKGGAQRMLEQLQAAFQEPGVDALADSLTEAEQFGDVERVRDGATAFINNKLIESLRGGDVAGGITLFEAYKKFVGRCGLPGGSMRSEIATNMVILAVYSKDARVETFFVDTLLPDHIGHTGLAYNLACYWATNGSRDKMLETVLIAVELGKPTERFLADTDFEPYWNEPDFLRALGLGPAEPPQSAVRRFEYRDDKSAKFWSVEVAGSDIHLAWGKIGAAGQKRTKSFPDSVIARAEAEKLIKSKTKKGYAELR